MQWRITRIEATIIGLVAGVVTFRFRSAAPIEMFKFLSGQTVSDAAEYDFATTLTHGTDQCSVMDIDQKRAVKAVGGRS